MRVFTDNIGTNIYRLVDKHLSLSGFYDWLTGTTPQSA
jgi:hypothetical protein